MRRLPDPHVSDAAFHLRMAALCLERARDRAETPAQHALLWRLWEAADGARRGCRQAAGRLRELRREAA